MRMPLLAAALLLIAASSAGAQIFAETDDTPTPEAKCETLCRRVYSAEPAKVTQCIEGCEQAARCTGDCEERFADNDEAKARCEYRCARAR